MHPEAASICPEARPVRFSAGATLDSPSRVTSMARQRIRKRPISDINVVPYIDVMLVLLVIFMITAPLLAQGVKIDLPNAPAKPMERSDREPLVVSVDSAGRYYANYGGKEEEPVDAHVLATRVAALLRYQPGTPVLVKGDAAASYGDVIRVMALLQTAGAPSVGLLTEPEEVAGH